jgi:hypothetical protein
MLSIPLNAESRTTSAAVINVIPMTDILVIKFMTCPLRREDKYLRAM